MVRSRKKNTALVAIGALLAATAVYIGAGKLLSRDAADRYFEVEGRNFQRIARSIDTYYSAFMESQKPFLESASSKHLEITADIRPGPEAPGSKTSAGRASEGLAGKTSAGSTSTGKASDGLAGKTSAGRASAGKASDGLAGLISNSKLVIDTRSRPDTAESLSDISFLMDKETIINAGLSTEKDTLYLSVPLLMPGRYFSTKLNRLDEAYDRFSVPIKPTRLINGPNIAGTLKFDKTAFMGSAVKLAAIFRKFIKPDNVRYGQNIGVQISGRSYKGREIIVSLDEEQATSLLHELALAVAEDDVLLQYTYGNIADLSALLGDAGLFRVYGYLEGKEILDSDDGGNSLPEKPNIKDVEGFRQDLQRNASRLTIKDGVVMTLAVDQAGNILNRKTEFDLLNTGDNSLSTLEIETGSSNNVFEDPRNRFADIVLTQYRNTASANTANPADVGKTTELLIRPDFGKSSDAGSSGSLTASYLTAVQGGSPIGADMKFDFSDKTDKVTLEKSRSIDYSVKITTGSGEGTVSGKWKEVSTEDKPPDTKNRTVTLDFNADLPFLGIDNFSTVLGFAEEDSFSIGPFALPAVNAGNTTDLNTLPPKDIERIKSQVLALFGNYQH